jgi:hypothetical protein
LEKQVVFFKDLPSTIFWGPNSQLWKGFRPNMTNIILIDNTVEKRAVCNNGSVVVLPTWSS